MSTDRPRVLLADPDMGHRARLTTALALAGYHVVEIVSGRALLETITRHVLEGSWRPVVVVASGPVADPDVSRILTALAGSRRAPPIVVLGDDRLAAGAFEAGATAVLNGEVSSHDVIGAVDDAFDSIALMPMPMPTMAEFPQSQPASP